MNAPIIKQRGGLRALAALFLGGAAMNLGFIAPAQAQSALPPAGTCIIDGHQIYGHQAYGADLNGLRGLTSEVANGFAVGSVSFCDYAKAHPEQISLVTSIPNQYSGAPIYVLTLPHLPPYQASSDSTTFYDANTQTLVFNPATQTTSTVDSYKTTIQGKIIGGTLLYNQSFDQAYGSSAVQAGVAAARLAITTVGGPGVVISAPTLISHNVTTSSQTQSSYTLNRIAKLDSVATVEYVGGTGSLPFLSLTTGPSYVPDPAYNGVQTVQVSDQPGTSTAPVLVGTLSDCSAVAASIPSAVRPVCAALPGNRLRFGFGGIALVTTRNDTYYVDQVDTIINTTLTSETYLIQGVVKPIGVIHAVASVAAFDQSEGFLGRGLAQADSRGSTRWHPWFEYWGHTNSTRGLGTAPGDARSGSGVDGGILYQVSSGFTLGAGIDYGTTNLALSDGSESGRLKLTQGAVFARVGAPHGVSLLIGGGIGGGSVNTSVTIPTITQTSTANEQVRNAWAGAEVSARISVAPGRLILTPLAGISYSSVKLNGFSEMGSTYAVAGPRGTQSRTREWAGVNAEIPVTSHFNLSVGVKAVHYDGDTAPNRAVSFVNYPTITGLAVTAPATNRWGGDMTASAAFQIASHLTLFANGSLLAQDGNTDRAFRVGVSSTF
ncbi:autotransporter outer membrane beta-barrel domain-containing protein [Sphingomonas sp. RT2P30]